MVVRDFRFAFPAMASTPHAMMRLAALLIVAFAGVINVTNAVQCTITFDPEGCNEAARDITILFYPPPRATL